MKAVVDSEVCIGCGLCPEVCPEVFKMTDDKAIAYANPVPAGCEDTCREAAEQCPVTAITIE